ncbi:precorrin-3B C(17)-methyltransferase [uncultured Flavonifractor sp.]|uniref:Precorrin-3B C(17)-methyltransferase n=1 Tax=Candidatus Flavonifractor intestinigallinarum TaxID=2838586 RepID=A0A9D2MP15_9FIRM|nr:precorrin-3B C(17)-methyltransferase [uncultured Flavonifractor sp.]HJB81265.1 precorrin-3B C(17)-methyltransferase [Candidatus Flavonifractor intestinigallinarum]
MKKVTVIGLGPGGGADLTGRARAALEGCDLIVGYTAYIELVRPDFPEKEVLSTGMRREVDRCRAAVEAALTGKDVAVVCSGDSGVYGMAGLIYEVAQEYDPIEIEVVPGITAACGGAAVLGAPLTHDFAVISLSDLLTPWEKIEKRLTAAAQADFVICLYNPSSRNRPDYLQRACDILLRDKDPNTVCGTVRNIGREGEEGKLLTLAQLRDAQVDMFTTVFIGNSQTKVLADKMVTPRGYLQRGE